jgi:hypothetical protein
MVGSGRITDADAAPLNSLVQGILDSLAVNR